MKELKNLVAFIALVIVPLTFWLSEYGMKLLLTGYGWVPYVYAPVAGLLFAYTAVGKPGQGLFTRVKQGVDEKGLLLLGAFWAIFIFITVVLLGIAYMVNREA